MREKHEMPNPRQPLTLDDATYPVEAVRVAYERGRAEERAAHASLVQEMETYLQHKADCAIGAGREYRAGNGHTCTCGLSALLRQSTAKGAK